ncbi:beta-lactamase-like protein [Syncephalastrum racemosum]|uniref:Beta-lactamase-like protein n=1 Tax=Syncephalastrum racemosum TaxID=13706 RepID=A0A1X2HRK3_SYNRA|nr:beta-lactamase-like protein [Syncephalastrum racemosum]
MGLPTAVADAAAAAAVAAAGSSSGSGSSKFALDVNYSIAQGRLESCEERVVFRTPNLDVDINSINLVLISNSDTMLGLPFLTEYMGYKGKIVAVEPAIEFARHRMEELVAYYGRSESGSGIHPEMASHFSQLGGMADKCTLDGWRSIYTLTDIDAALKKVQPVRYGEQLSLFNVIQYEARKSGMSLGSANWLLQTVNSKIVLVNASSALRDRHPAPIDFDIMDNADVVLVSGAQMSNPSDRGDAYTTSIKKVLAKTAHTLHMGGNVLLPISTMNAVFDWLPRLSKHLDSIDTPRPIYLLGVSASKSIKYGNISGEWMTQVQHERMFASEKPLEIVDGATVHVFNDLAALSRIELRHPCVVIAGDSLCFGKGPLAWCLQHLYNPSRPNNCIIITDPATTPAGVENGPTHHWEFCFAPIDARMTLTAVVRWILSHDSKPNQRIILPKNGVADQLLEQWTDVLSGKKMHQYDYGSPTRIPLDEKYVDIHISQEMERLLRPLPDERVFGQYVCDFDGVLVAHDNRYELRPITKSSESRRLIPKE